MTAATIGVELPEELELRSTMRVPFDECDVRLAYPWIVKRNPAVSAEASGSRRRGARTRR
jgi:hypothetical protein